VITGPGDAIGTELDKFFGRIGIELPLRKILENDRIDSI
jgi:hypothetical protein